MDDRNILIKGAEEILSYVLPDEKDTSGIMVKVGWVRDVLALLKEQEAVESKTGHWIFESAYCEAWSHTCSECGKRMSTAYNTYANYCWNCGAKMEGM